MMQAEANHEPWSYFFNLPAARTVPSEIYVISDLSSYLIQLRKDCLVVVVVGAGEGTHSEVAVLRYLTAAVAST